MALDYLCSIDHLPMFLHGNLPMKPSNSQRRRWLESRSVLINGQKPGPRDPVTLPVEQLIFFPKNNKSRCTMLDYTDHRAFHRSSPH